MRVVYIILGATPQHYKGCQEDLEKECFMDELHLQRFKLLAGGYAKGFVIYGSTQLCSGFEGCVASKWLTL